ncbi:hypothetical protein [Novosphingobium sp. 9U]|uniref:hypothetical protein n=1 Tax=Novosphingobium sp. 9U TaxID=2653158 RepID=UPI0012F2B6EA|nr:hypothetical protein [Novosphingobium sp. 9U]VWX53229.1 hypothetical protein NOVOSPHI9U_420472 [Novosphingobium sp. 9U]
MTAPEDAKPIVIEPLDPARHDRAAFSCGIDQVDNFFRRTANKLTKAGNVRTFVMIGLGGELIGFYAINAPSTIPSCPSGLPAPALLMAASQRPTSR